MTDDIPDPDEFVDLVTVSSPMVAQMLKSQLEAAGIPAVVPGADLKDEFAAFGQLSGLIGGTVRVPRRHVDAANRILEEARQAGDDLEAAGPGTDDGPG